MLFHRVKPYFTILCCFSSVFDVSILLSGPPNLNPLSILLSLYFFTYKNQFSYSRDRVNAMFSDILSQVNFPWQLLQCFSSYVLNLESKMNSTSVTKKNGGDRLAVRARVLITTGAGLDLLS